MLNVANTGRKLTRSTRAILLGGVFLPAGMLLASGAVMAQSGDGQPPAPAPQAQAQPAAPDAQGTEISDEWRATLAKFGTFSKNERYGEIWKPNAVPADWKPYPACYWTYKKDIGWYLDDPTEWGKIVHHHGRWTQDEDQTWVWTAGTEFSPAWVVWDNSQSKVGWAPKLPDIDEKDVDFESYKQSGAFQYLEAAKFGMKCGPSIPPVASAPPPPRFAAPAPRVADMAPPPVRVAPIPVVGGGGGYVTGGGYAGGGGVWTGGGWTGGGICRFKPWLPRCGRPPVNICKIKPWLKFCKVADHRPPSCSTGIRPSWCAPVCKTKPFLPMCKHPGKKPDLVKKFKPHKMKIAHMRPHRPGKIRPHVRPHRPFVQKHVRPFRPHVRPGRIVRPNRVLRPNRVFSQRPMIRPARNFQARHQFRPRQNFRPARSFNRPVVRQRFSGGRGFAGARRFR